jgi:hypothetical protein
MTDKDTVWANKIENKRQYQWLAKIKNKKFYVKFIYMLNYLIN